MPTEIACFSVAGVKRRAGNRWINGVSMHGTPPHNLNVKHLTTGHLSIGRGFFPGELNNFSLSGIWGSLIVKANFLSDNIRQSSPILKSNPLYNSKQLVNASVLNKNQRYYQTVEENFHHKKETIRKDVTPEKKENVGRRKIIIKICRDYKSSASIKQEKLVCL